MVKPAQISIPSKKALEEGGPRSWNRKLVSSNLASVTYGDHKRRRVKLCIRVFVSSSCRFGVFETFPHLLITNRAQPVIVRRIVCKDLDCTHNVQRMNGREIISHQVEYNVYIVSNIKRIYTYYHNLKLHIVIKHWINKTKFQTKLKKNLKNIVFLFFFYGTHDRSFSAWRCIVDFFLDLFSHDISW